MWGHTIAPPGPVIHLGRLASYILVVEPLWTQHYSRPPGSQVVLETNLDWQPLLPQHFHLNATSCMPEGTDGFVVGHPLHVKSVHLDEPGEKQLLRAAICLQRGPLPYRKDLLQKLWK